jgi:hypothetical protein
MVSVTTEQRVVSSRVIYLVENQRFPSVWLCNLTISISISCRDDTTIWTALGLLKIQTLFQRWYIYMPNCLPPWQVQADSYFKSGKAHILEQGGPVLFLQCYLQLPHKSMIWTEKGSLLFRSCMQSATSFKTCKCGSSSIVFLSSAERRASR